MGIRINVELDDDVLGTLDVEALEMGAWIDLENSGTPVTMIRWLVAHAGADQAELTKKLRARPLRDTFRLWKAIDTAFAEAVRVPKTNGTPS